MTEYALAPSSKWDATNSPYRTPRVMLEQGLLSAYRVRGNGTMRHLELYPLDSTGREAAEYVSDRVDMDGASVQAVARELHVSTPTVRRYLESLELTEEIEEGEWDGLSFDSAGNPVWDVTWVESEEVAEELAPASQPVRRTRAGRKCTSCSKTVTARTSAATVHGAVGFQDMCAPCYEDYGWENTHSDQGHGPDNRDAECPICTRDEAAAARNRARFTNTPVPTSAERAAALADVPGSQCEPTGTTPDELAETLEASVAVAQTAPRGAALAMCFCGDQGAHTPGAQGCKNNPIPRRTRSHG